MGLTPGQAYQVSLAVVSGGQVGNRASNTFTTLPRDVQNLTTEAVSVSTVTVSWDVFSDSLQDTFEIKYEYEDQVMTKDVAHVTSKTSYSEIVAGLTPGQTYKFSVRAISGGTYSRRASGTISNETIIPDAVTGLEVLSRTPHTVELRWQYPSDSERDSFTISYQGEFEERDLKNIRDIDATTIKVEMLHPGERYTFNVTARSEDQTSALTQVTAVTIPFNPENFTASEILTRSILLTWDSGLSFNTGWLLEYEKQDETFDSDTFSTNVTQLIPGKHYIFKISGLTVENVMNTTGEELRVTARPDFVSTVSIDKVDTTSIKIIYTEDTSEGVFNNYSFSINPRHHEPQIKSRTADREVLFDQLIPGTQYIISGFVQSGEAKSDVKTWTDFTAPSKPSITCVPSDSGTSMVLTIKAGPAPSGQADSYIMTCAPQPGSNATDCEVKEITVAFGITEYTFRGLTPAKYYDFSIKSVVTFEGFTAKYSETDEEPCDTSEASPGPVKDFVYIPDTLSAHSVTLSWKAPPQPNGVIKAYKLTGNGTKDGESMHDLSLRSLNPDNYSTIYDDLRPGHVYNIEIFARNEGFDGEKSQVTFTTKILPPFLPPHPPHPQRLIPKVPDQEDAVRHNSIKLDLVNPFSERDSRITSYSVIVWSEGYDYDSSNDGQREISESWYDFKQSQDDVVSPYVTIKCSNLFTDPNACGSASSRRRRKRATEGQAVTVTVGGDASCDVERHRGYCNGPLRPSTGYIVMIRAYNEKGDFTDGYRSGVIQTAGDPLIVIVAVVVPIVLLVVAALIVVVVLMRKGIIPVKKESSKPSLEKPDIPIKPTPNTSKTTTRVSRAVKIDVFEEYVKGMSKDSNFKFAEEYEDLKPVGKDMPFSVADLAANRPKNRFTNILPYDHSRVKLLPTDDEEMGVTDYINADWMPGYNSKREFIVTQGPLPATKDDFWRMVWEYNAQAIVMLTRCVERGRDKCDHYWPFDSEPMFYGDLQVSIVYEEKTDDHVYTRFQVAQGEQVRTITHFHYIAWPDFSTPEAEGITPFIQEVRSRLSYDSGPVIVHCSAGVGRSGTYIALDRLFQTIEEHDAVDVYGIVHEMRMSRPLMVQTEKQYIFIHNCLLHVLKSREAHQNEGYEPDEDGSELYANFNVGNSQ